MLNIFGFFQGFIAILLSSPIYFSSFPALPAPSLSETCANKKSITQIMV